MQHFRKKESDQSYEGVNFGNLCKLHCNYLKALVKLVAEEKVGMFQHYDVIGKQMKEMSMEELTVY